MTNQAIINWNQLSMILGDEGDPIDEEMAELFRDFIDDASGRLTTLDLLDPMSNPQGVSHEAHKIRGAALSFGFEKFAAVLQTIETRVLELTPDEIRRLTASAREIFGLSRQEIEQRYTYLAAVS